MRGLNRAATVPRKTEIEVACRIGAQGHEASKPEEAEAGTNPAHWKGKCEGHVRHHTAKVQPGTGSESCWRNREREATLVCPKQAIVWR